MRGFTAFIEFILHLGRAHARTRSPAARATVHGRPRGGPDAMHALRSRARAWWRLAAPGAGRTPFGQAPHIYDPSAGQEGARSGGHSWRKVLGRYGRGQLREDEGDGQVGLVRALVHLL